MEKKENNDITDLLEFEEIPKVPTEDEIREYVIEHKNKLSLIDFAKWVIKKSSC